MVMMTHLSIPGARMALTRLGETRKPSQQRSWVDSLNVQLRGPSLAIRLGFQLAYAAAYFLIGLVSFRFANLESAFAGTFYLHEGYGLALAAALGLRSLPSVFVGHLALVLFQGLSWQHASLSALENASVLALSVGFFRLTSFRATMARPTDFLLLVAGSLLAFQIPSRLAGFLILAWSSQLHGLHWGDLAAIVEESLADESICQVLVAVVLLTTVDELRRLRSVRYWLSGCGAVAALVVGLALLLWGAFGSFNPLHVFQIVYLAVMLITFGFGLHGAAFANLAALILLQWAANQQTSPFFHLLASQYLQNGISTVLIGAITSSCLVGALLREKSDKEATLVELATRDMLTGLYNRRFFFDAANREMGRTHRHDVDILLLCLDLDHFKKINDTHGHAAGDAVLAVVGDILRGESRQVDVAARLGGEEFAVLACNTCDAEAIANRLRDAIRSRLEQEPDLVRFTVSIGITRVQRDDQDIAAVLKRADEALYEAKRNGRDCVVFKS